MITDVTKIDDPVKILVSEERRARERERGSARVKAREKTRGERD